MLRQLGLLSISPVDCRRLEIVATGLPIARGAPVAIDATMVSPLHADGSPWNNSDVRPGVPFERAEEAKETTYPELLGHDAVKLITLAYEVGGRWSDESHDLVLLQLKQGVLLATFRQLHWCPWWALLSCAQQDALASTLVDDQELLLHGHDAVEPPLVDILMEELWNTP